MQETLIPSALASHVKENVISYLKTTFNIKNKGFADNFEKHIRSDNGLFKGPYVDIKLPFKAASKLPDELLDIKPLFRPFEHQVQAFKRITSKEKVPQNTLVVTGTGSGKTECFLIPALDHCARNHSKPGIKVIILYPMNALAFDQARRIGEMIFDYPELKNKVTAGILVGEDRDEVEKRISYKKMTSPNHIIDHRDSLIANPPDILLTNYKMLDNLLMKPGFKNLWQNAIGEDSTFKYLVLDEMHTYDGAQGADVALLIRRLKAKLQVKNVTCVGTSATLSSETDGTEVLKTFAGRLFGENFETDSIIRESRQSIDEVLTPKVIYTNIPNSANNLIFEEHGDIKTYVASMAQVWFQKDLNSEELGTAILSHSLTRTILECLEGKPVSISDLVDKIRAKTIPMTEDILSSYLALVAHATREVEFNNIIREVPLFFCRVQLWMREMRRILSNLEWDQPTFKWIDEIKQKNENHFLPPVFCEECGEQGYLISAKDNEFVWNVMYIYEQYAESTNKVRYLFPWRDEFHISDELYQSNKINICPACGQREYEQDLANVKHDKCPSCSHAWKAFKVHTCLSKEKKRDKRQCPSCESAFSLKLLASRATTMASIVNGQLFLSKINPQNSKRLLVFSDSVQDASHRAGYFNARTFRFNFRTAVQTFLEAQKGDITLLEAIDPFWNFWIAKERLGEKKAAATFSPSDLMILDQYEAYIENDDKNYLNILKQRILWEFYLEYSLRSQVGRTLEKTGSSAIYVDANELIPILDKLFDSLKEEHIQIREAGIEGLRSYYLGIMERSLTRGAISFDFFQNYRKKESVWELNRKTYPWIGRLPKGKLDGSEVGALPKFITTNSFGNIFDFAGPAEQGDSWYSYWYKKCFQRERSLDRNEILVINKKIFEELTRAGIMDRVLDKHNTYNYGFKAEKIKLTKNISTIICNSCAHKIVVPKNELKIYLNLGCVISHCKGTYSSEIDNSAKFYQNIYRSGDVERIFASEHTGLLSRKKRESIEVEFKESDEFKRRPDSVNLLSCTPTLEMGIDIGDLSATVVASLPPTASNYQQQIGRAGRKTGSALIVSIAQMRPRDLLYYRFPEELIIGNILPPGCFLDAPDILKRQFFAFILDQQYSVLFKGISSLKTEWLTEENRKLNPDGFISRFTKLMNQDGTKLVDLYRNEFSANVISVDTWNEIKKEFLKSTDNQITFVNRLKRSIEEFDIELSELIRKKKIISEKADAIKLKETNGGSLTEIETQIKTECRSEYASIAAQMELVGARSGIFEFLTHRGFLPNYAFQEDNIELLGVIYNRNQKNSEEKSLVRHKESFDRPAKMGLRELAPLNTFYGGGYKLEIDQIDVGGNTKSLVEEWRACRNCGHLERVVGDDRTLGGCPICGDSLWADNGQKTQMLKFQKAIAVADSYNAHISDDSEDRQRKFFKVRSFFDIPKTSNREAWAHTKSSDFVFGLEFINSLILREINFGSDDLVKANKFLIGGEELPGGFHICTSCGKVAKPDPVTGYKIQHSRACRYAKTSMAPEQQLRLPNEKPILLYRELKSEGIRLLLPVSDYEGEARTASIKAAIMLGFIKKFGGRPMHLEISEQNVVESFDDNSIKRFLVLFDAVPGGTGFLRELWSKDSFFEVIKLARNVLDNCTCKDSVDSDGCLRCILAGASQYEYPLISRKEAMRYLDAILSHENDMEVKPGGLDDVDVSSFLDSDLEYRFLSIVRNLKSNPYTDLLAKQNIVIEEINSRDDIRDGIVIKLRKDTKVVEYKMTFQKNLNESDKSTRVDFYFESLNGEAKPIALYLDGYKYHAGKFSNNQLEKDFIKRSALSNGEGVDKHAVWNLSWHDIDSFIKDNGGVREYLGMGNLDSSFLKSNSLAQFFDFLFINTDLNLAKIERNYIIANVVNKNGKYQDNSIIENLDGLSLSPGLLQRTLTTYDETHADSGLFGWRGSSGNGVVGILLNSATKKITSSICFESKLSEREDEENFKIEWNMFLRSYNILQIFSENVVCKVWAEKKL